ncbi:MAG: hypothetical protein R3186_10580 [Ruegeria sp.]|nr:hypothetical protein [Ruegeria sp.]
MAQSRKRFYENTEELDDAFAKFARHCISARNKAMNADRFDRK